MASLPPIPEGFSLTSELPPIPEGFELVGGTETPSKQLGNKIAATPAYQKQLERFKSRSKKSAARLAVEDTLAEPFRFGAEAALVPLQSAHKVAGDWIPTIARAGYGLATGEGGMAAVNADKTRDSYQPPSWLQSPLEPSKTGQLISKGIEAGTQGLGAVVGDDTAKGISEVAMTTLGLAPLPKMVGAAIKTPGAVARKVGDVAVEKFAPSSWEPAGTPAKKGAIPTADKTQARLNRIQTKAPKVVENRVKNAVDDLLPPDKTYVDPAAARQTRGKVVKGDDNFEQLANEGLLHEVDANGNVIMQADGITPKPYEVGKGGVSAAVAPALQMDKIIWGEVENALSRHGKNNPTIQTAGVKGLESFDGRGISASELQKVISENNEVLYKTKKATLGIEDTIKRNELKKVNGQLNDMLHNEVGQLLEGVGMKDLHAEFGGARTFTDAIMNGAERKLQTVFGPELTDVPAPGGLTYKAANIASRTAKKYFKNPDRAFENLIRARRAQGNVVRNRVLTNEPVGPEVPLRGGVNTQGLTAPDTAVPLRGGVNTQGLTAPDTAVPLRGGVNAEGLEQPGPQIQTTQGPSAPIRGGEPSPVLQADLGFTEPTTQKAPNKVEAKNAEVRALKNRLSDVENQLKAGLKETGKSGKAAVDALAMQLGVSAALITTYLLTKDEKKRQALLPEFQK